MSLEKLSGLSDRHVFKVQRPWFSADGQREVTLGVLKQYINQTQTQTVEWANVLDKPAAFPTSSTAISDSTTTGRAVLTAATQSAGRDALGATGGVWPAASLPDATDQVKGAVTLDAIDGQIVDALPPFTIILRNAPATNVIETDASIGASAFEGDASVTAVLGGKNTTSIGVYAFDVCNALTSISLPAATTIGGLAFNGCGSLASISLPVATSIGSTAFQSCSSLTSVSLPAATTIGGNAFNNCGSLASISLPVATSIGEAAFYYCTSLTSVSLPAATTIGVSALQGCSALVSISLPAATTIGGSAFNSCGSLASISLPAATTIGGNAFQSCSSLASVSLPAATTIGVVAFYHCTSLTSVSLPVATSIGDAVFGSCPSLTSGVYLNAPLSGLSANALTGSSITTIHLRPAPNTPAGWTLGPGQTIKGKSGVNVVADWTTWPNLP